MTLENEYQIDENGQQWAMSTIFVWDLASVVFDWQDLAMSTVFEEKNALDAWWNLTMRTVCAWCHLAI